MSYFPRSPLVVAVTIFGLLFGSPVADACTRCVYLGPNGTVIVARSMDWAEDPGSNLYCFPRGMERDGASGANSLKWTSKYGSLVTSFYEGGTVDGMNEKGLVANALYLVESDYGKPDGRPTVSITAYTQYVLDSFATVDEAVKELSRESFAVVPLVLPNGKPAQGHLSVSDPSGNSAIFEYLGGKLVVHHGRQYQVMTNSPAYDQQLALNTYWNTVGGEAMLPGTHRASDRFVRASFYIGAVPKTDEIKTATAATLSVIRSVSVPLGLTTPGQPNIAATVWRTLHDQKNRIVYFDAATSPTVCWVPLADLDFTAGAAVKKLELAGGKTYNGNASAQMIDAQPFQFLQADAK
jgi:choloylglycine hydrolase